MKIHLEKNFINEIDANKIINHLDDSDLIYGPMSNTRRTLRFGIDKFNGTSSKLSELNKLELILNKYIDMAENLINVNWQPIQPVKISTLWLSKQIAGSSIKPHSDLDGGINSQYTHSGIIYLNTQNNGGEIYFPLLNKEFKPELGDLILFDCVAKESLHGVKKTTQNRYAIPLWFTDQKEYFLR